MTYFSQNRLKGSDEQTTYDRRAFQPRHYTVFLFAQREEAYATEQDAGKNRQRESYGTHTGRHLFVFFIIEPLRITEFWQHQGNRIGSRHTFRQIERNDAVVRQFCVEKAVGHGDLT